jgi:hypothetical protein
MAQMSIHSLKPKLKKYSYFFYCRLKIKYILPLVNTYKIQPFFLLHHSQSAILIRFQLITMIVPVMLESIQLTSH